MNMHNDKTTTIRPFVVKDLVRMIMSRKNIAFDDALFYLYSSDLYMKLLDDDAKMWYMSTVALYELLEEEKFRVRRVELPDKILMFRVFCIESYCDIKDVYHEDALALFRQYDVLEFLDDTFEVLHTQDLQYIVETIDRYIKVRRREK